MIFTGNAFYSEVYLLSTPVLIVFLFTYECDAACFSGGVKFPSLTDDEGMQQLCHVF